MIDPQEEGESDRLYLGIDGTMADAQDVDHPFVRALGGHCSTCGLAESYRRHSQHAAPTKEGERGN